MLSRRSFTRLLAALPFVGATRPAVATVPTTASLEGITCSEDSLSREVSLYRNATVCVRRFGFDRTIGADQFAEACQSLPLPRKGDEFPDMPYAKCGMCLPIKDGCGAVRGARIIYLSSNVKGVTVAL